MTNYDKNDFFNIRKKLENLYFSYGADTEKMNFRGIITIFAAYNIPELSIKNILKVVGQCVSGYNTDGSKRKPTAQDFTDAISALRYNKHDISKAVLAIRGR